MRSFLPEKHCLLDDVTDEFVVQPGMDTNYKECFDEDDCSVVGGAVDGLVKEEEIDRLRASESFNGVIQEAQDTLLLDSFATGFEDQELEDNFDIQMIGDSFSSPMRKTKNENSEYTSPIYEDVVKPNVIPPSPSSVAQVLQIEKAGAPKKPRLHITNSKPKRPNSAYNLFFQIERERLISGVSDETPISAADVEHAAMERRQLLEQQHDATKPKRKIRRTHGKVSFAELARTIAQKWKLLDPDTKDLLKERAAFEKAQYLRDLEAWTKKGVHEENTNDQGTPEDLPTAGSSRASLNKKVDVVKNQTTLSALEETQSVIQMSPQGTNKASRVDMWGSSSPSANRCDPGVLHKLQKSRPKLTSPRTDSLIALICHRSQPSCSIKNSADFQNDCSWFSTPDDQLEKTLDQAEKIFDSVQAEGIFEDEIKNTDESNCDPFVARPVVSGKYPEESSFENLKQDYRGSMNVPEHCCHPSFPPPPSMQGHQSYDMHYSPYQVPNHYGFMYPQQPPPLMSPPGPSFPTYMQQKLPRQQNPYGSCQGLTPRRQRSSLPMNANDQLESTEYYPNQQIDFFCSEEDMHMNALLSAFDEEH